jgi:hypothetical protein
MPQDDVRRALELMTSDDEVADRLAAGDLADVADLDLSAEEQTLVTDAAADLPEVAGFASDYLLNFSKLGIKSDFVVKGEFAIKGEQGHKMNLALNYAFNKI